jgi:hypothetical protein
VSPRPRPTLLNAALAILALLGSAAHAKPPSWDKRIDGAARFQVLKPLANEAVLDRETGLVWERNVDDEPAIHPWRTWRSLCLARHTGGRLGWRLPHAHELQTLVDPATGDLPAGHPFRYFATQQTPTATLFDEANALWFAPLPHEQVALNVNSLIGDIAAALWCVRGPLGGTSDS